MCIFDIYQQALQSHAFNVVALLTHMAINFAINLYKCRSRQIKRLSKKGEQLTSVNFDLKQNKGLFDQKGKTSTRTEMTGMMLAQVNNG